ncbi:hypothetical protein Pint_26104 [Pistacia integerrima]|uniref:Uncharacterized protein n=1 Tax=Pistacia integerrima TaxID=434235 RepID=A0ACC0YE59_9ROSI|nr:hypothetical protein Pint_26104 [Pistacia integerrima]
MTISKVYETNLQNSSDFLFLQAWICGWHGFPGGEMYISPDGTASTQLSLKSQAFATIYPHLYSSKINKSKPRHAFFTNSAADLPLLGYNWSDNVLSSSWIPA